MSFKFLMWWGLGWGLFALVVMWDELNHSHYGNALFLSFCAGMNLAWGFVSYLGWRNRER